MKRRLATLALLSWTGCADPPQPAPVAKPDAQGSQAVAADSTANVARPDTAPAEVEMQELAPGVEIPKKLPNGIPLMTPMDFALCMIPQTDLPTVEERRKRGWARRKLIMNNPDSPTARALNDLADAANNGELSPPNFEHAGKSSAKDSGVVFSLPGTKPQGGRPPAGSRPPAGARPKGNSEESPAP